MTRPTGPRTPRRARPADASPDASDATGATDVEALAVAETHAWLERIVIGLRLCPYAREARRHGRTRIVASRATQPQALLDDLAREVRRLLLTPASQLETTLLVHPGVLGDFDRYNDFLDLADAALVALGAEGVLQVASFHPHYRFAGTAADDITNATNRSPHPMLQLLREASVGAALETLADPAVIYEANQRTLRTLGSERWAALQAACRRDALEAGNSPPAASA